jgi:hypothetical protein
MRAFKAKDADELEAIAQEVKDDLDLPTDPNGEGEIHIHINGNGDPAPSDATFTQDEPADLAAHIAQNAEEHAAMSARIDALEQLCASLSAGGDRDEDPDVMPKEALDELPGELQEGAAKARDSMYFTDSFRDTVAMAEILVPGIRVPTFDGAAKPGQTYKAICALRKQALDLAYGQPATRSILDDLLGGKALETRGMTCDAIRSMFRAASAARRSANNASNSRRSADTKASPLAGVRTLADINRLNAERYGQK